MMSAEAKVSSGSARVSDGVLRLLAAQGVLTLRVAGSCMAPAVQDGVVVAVAPAGRYLPGDVVAFRQPSTGRLLLHRVLGWRPFAGRWALVVQGDGCAAHDGPVLPEQVIGKPCRDDGSGRPFAVPLAHRLRAAGRWISLALAWLGRRLR
jgi:hypothetical protein